MYNESIMKKIYIIPDIKVVHLNVEKMLAFSDIKSIGDVDDIDYGGVDNDGELDPCTKENYFDFEW